MSDQRNDNPHVPSDADKPIVRLIGEDGNVFNVIGLCVRALKQAGLQEASAEFKERAFRCHSYDEVLILAMAYCEVE